MLHKTPSDTQSWWLTLSKHNSVWKSRRAPVNVRPSNWVKMSPLDTMKQRPLCGVRRVHFIFMSLTFPLLLLPTALHADIHCRWFALFTFTVAFAQIWLVSLCLIRVSSRLAMLRYIKKYQIIGSISIGALLWSKKWGYQFSREKSGALGRVPS